MNKTALIIFIHFIVSIIVQLGLFIHTVFFYDYSIKSVIIWIIVGITLTYIDYCVCVRILKDENIVIPWIGHFADLIFAIPSIILWGYVFILDMINNDAIKSKRSNHEIVLIIGIILVNACFMMERFSLVKKGGD